MRRGPHKSALEYIDFLREEFASMLNKAQWTLLPADLVTELHTLRLSPLGVVPQHARRPRSIVDYTFFDVNADTVPLAPSDAMQFGRALHRILSAILHADPRFGKVYLSKVDIADGFYRIWLLPRDIPKLGVLFPTLPGEPALIAFPLTLPMGWVASPPYFCAATETVADLANAAYADHAPYPFHRLEAVAESPIPSGAPPPIPDTGPPVTGIVAGTPPVPPTPIPPPSAVPFPRRYRPLGRHHARTPVAYTDVYVDDFITVVQGNASRRRDVKRKFLHSLDRVFRPLEPSDSAHRNEPASEKKFRQGDGTWSTRKLVLGWIIDTADSTITLPPHRLARLHDLLASVPRATKRIATRQWHKLLGELRSMVTALPGARGLFSTLQTAFQQPLDHGRRLRLSTTIHDFLDDFRWLAAELSSRPTRIAETLPTTASAIGSCDAAGTGMGGVLFLPARAGTPGVTCAGTHYRSVLWRQPFPGPIQASLQSDKNPHGTITNSDLELAGTIAQHDVLAHLADIRERTVHNLHDNTPAVFWQRKGSTTTSGPAAYLLRLQAVHQRFHRYVPRHDYIPGKANAMADDCSRRWDLSDAALLTYFNATYPQVASWELSRLRPPMNSALTSALYRQRSDPASFLAVPPAPTNIGSSGWISPTPLASTPASPISKTPSPSSKSSPPAIATAASLPAASPSALAQWKTPYVPSVRCLPGAWGPGTSVRTPSAPSTFAYNANYDPMARTTRRRTG
jgi:hypothetical protein